MIDTYAIQEAIKALFVEAAEPVPVPVVSQLVLGAGNNLTLGSSNLVLS